MKFLSYFFRFLTIIGFFLLVAGMAGSHGHFKFRPHMTEDWIIFGTPIIGILGWVLTGLMSASKNGVMHKAEVQKSIEFLMLLPALHRAVAVLNKTENGKEFADRLEIVKNKIQQLELQELDNLWIWFAPTGVWDEFVGESGIELGTEIFELTEKLRSQVN